MRGGESSVPQTQRDLLLAAVVLFLLAAFAVKLGTFDLVTLGLAAFAASFLVEHWKR